MAAKKSTRVIAETAKLFGPALHRLAGLKPTIAIVGMGGSNFMYNLDFEAENKKPADKVWAINSAAVWFRNVDMAIAMDDLRRDRDTHPGYVDALVKLPISLMTTEHYPEYPNTVAYPLREVVNEVFRGSKWLANACLKNTVCFAVAYAIVQKPAMIKLYGCDFTMQDDPRLLRAAWPDRRDLNDPDWFCYYGKDVIRHRAPGEPGETGTNFLLGLAFERGIDIYICNYSTLLDNDRPDFLYGYQHQPKL